MNTTLNQLLVTPVSLPGGPVVGKAFRPHASFSQYLSLGNCYIGVIIGCLLECLFMAMMEGGERDGDIVDPYVPLKRTARKKCEAVCSIRVAIADRTGLFKHNCVFVWCVLDGGMHIRPPCNRHDDRLGGVFTVLVCVDRHVFLLNQPSGGVVLDEGEGFRRIYC